MCFLSEKMPGSSGGWRECTLDGLAWSIIKYVLWPWHIYSTCATWIKSSQGCSLQPFSNSQGMEASQTLSAIIQWTAPELLTRAISCYGHISIHSHTGSLGQWSTHIIMPHKIILPSVLVTISVQVKIFLGWLSTMWKHCEIMAFHNDVILGIGCPFKWYFLKRAKENGICLCKILCER